jgi:hypothetical protein
LDKIIDKIEIENLDRIDEEEVEKDQVKEE